MPACVSAATTAAAAGAAAGMRQVPRWLQHTERRCAGGAPCRRHTGGRCRCRCRIPALSVQLRLSYSLGARCPCLPAGAQLASFHSADENKVRGSWYAPRRVQHLYGTSLPTPVERTCQGRWAARARAPTAGRALLRDCWRRRKKAGGGGGGARGRRRPPAATIGGRCWWLGASAPCNWPPPRTHPPTLCIGAAWQAFGVAFATPVADSRGAPHVLEHTSLVGGTERFPVKARFCRCLLACWLAGLLAASLSRSLALSLD